MVLLWNLCDIVRNLNMGLFLKHFIPSVVISRSDLTDHQTYLP